MPFARLSSAGCTFNTHETVGADQHDSLCFGQIARAGSYDEMRKVALPIVWRSHGSDMPLNFLMMPSEAENDRGKIHWSTPIARPSR